MAHEYRVLEHEPDMRVAVFVPIALAEFARRLAVDGQLAGIGALDPSQNVQQRGLPAGRRPANGNEATAAERRRHVGKRRAPFTWIALYDVACFNHDSTITFN